ncbi:MAG: hypothetical protein ABI960_07980 [Candidatus Eisenbacteria bacterium]
MRAGIGLLGALLAMQGGALAPQLADAAGWHQTDFLVGGFGVNNAPYHPERLVLLDRAGLDLVQGFDQRLPTGTILVGQLDSLRRALPDFRLRAILHDAPKGDDAGHLTGNVAPVAQWPALRATLTRNPLDGGSTLGWCLWDEPSTRPQLDAIGELSRRMRRDPVAGGKIPYVNLLPIAPLGGGAGYLRDFGAGVDRRAAYAAYLDAYLSQFDAEPEPAPLLCFDHYPFQHDGREAGDYFENLEIARDRAVARGRPGMRIPLWVVIQLAAFKPPGAPFMEGPTLAQVRWQAWTAVAYGAKSISYWTTGTIDDPAPRTGFRGGLLELNGRPTSKYAAIRTLNAELHALGPTLMRLDPVAVFHVAPGRQRVQPEDRIGDARRVYCVVSAVSGSGREDCLLGYFKEQGTGDDYLLVVNQSLARPRSFRIRLAVPADSIARIDEQNGRPRILSRRTSALDASVAPASVGLYRISGPMIESLPGVREVRTTGDGSIDYVVPAGVLRVNRASGVRSWVSVAAAAAGPDSLQITPEGVVRARR